jgi:hypothetical protein
VADHLDAPGLTSPNMDMRVDITDISAFQNPADPTRSFLAMSLFTGVRGIKILRTTSPFRNSRKSSAWKWCRAAAAPKKLYEVTGPWRLFAASRAFAIVVEPVDGSPDARRSLVHRSLLQHQALDPLLPAGLLGCAPQPCPTAP